MSSTNVLAIDPGTKRHGAAVSDSSGIAIQPLEAISAEPDEAALERMAELVREWNVAEIVVGLPINADGSEGPSAKAARALADRIARHVHLPVALWDERLTTEEAERQLLSEGRTLRQMKRKKDARSAAIILQSYLASKKGRS